jgi:hypothetical protein
MSDMDDKTLERVWQTLSDLERFFWWDIERVIVPDKYVIWYSQISKAG